MQPATQIEPIYKSTSPNAPIELGTHRITLLHGANRGSQGEASFALRFSPSPGLVGSMHLPEYSSTDDITALEIPAFSVRFPVLPPQVTITGSGTHMVIRPNPERIEFFRRKPTKIKEVIFQIINFEDFIGGKNDLTLRTAGVLRRIGRIVLTWDGWRITIHAVPEIDSLIECLSEGGGFAITHVGKIERIRGGFFDVKRTNELLEMLRLYLSFARGAFVICPLAVGCDGSHIVWERWSAHIVYPWRRHPGWFSRRPGNLLEDVFPGFAALFKKPHWKRQLRAVLYWYLRANNTVEGPGVDGGIILSQAALEKLAWVYLVESSQTLTSQQYSGLRPTSRKLAQLFSQMSIPSDIPTELRALTRVAKKHKWADAPTALTKIRNDLIHAEERYLAGTDTPFFDAWSLTQRYVELVILRLAGYAGHYTDRISAKWVGETTKVPWA